MINLMLGIVNLAWKALLLYAVVMVIKAMAKGGKDTIHDMLDTIAMGLKAGMAKLQKWFYQKYKEVKSEPDKTEET